MNRNFDAYIALGKSLIEDQNLDWEIPINNFGEASDGIGWNLTAFVNAVPPPIHYFRDLGTDTKTLSEINKNRANAGLIQLRKQALSLPWQELLKAAVAEQLFYKRNTTGHVVNNVVRPLRVLATCVTCDPWALNIDELNRAIEIAKAIQASGKLGDILVGLVKSLFDANHLLDAGPMFAAIDNRRLEVRSRVKSKHTMSDDELRSHLNERKGAEKLPEKQAFWELSRIVFTEKPKSFGDELRFAAIKTMILTGLRVGEVALLPEDWRRERTYFDSKGIPAGHAGGISNSVALRHFAEKQQEEASNSRLLYENTQPIPEMFQGILSDSLDRVARITAPLRRTLKEQCESGRLLAKYGDKELVPFTEIYSELTGNPFWLKMDREPYIKKYRLDFDPTVLYEITRIQSDSYTAKRTSLDMSIYVFGNRLKKQMLAGESNLQFRSRAGNLISEEERMSWSDVYFRIDELEAHIRKNVPTKVSDTMPFATNLGSLSPWQLLFLHPKRSLAEERNDGICDVTKYISVGRPDPEFIITAIGEHPTVPSLFKEYGKSDADRAMKINTHALRHLQNTELFRLGVADTIISKRYNRRSVAQSYVYDHRSLAEDLESMDIAEDIELMLGPKATTVAKMIMAGKASGPIVEAFKRIQTSDGDRAAFEYLRVEADGFHATPYGHCLNSFTVDPCPKHLECFSGCRHLSATDLPENRANLKRLEEKFKIAIVAIKSRPASSIGWHNQLQHAKVRLTGVQKLLATKPGDLVFPEGPDFSKAKQASLFDT